MRGRIQSLTFALRFRQFSGSAKRLAASERVSREIIELRQEERKTLYQLREHVTEFVRQIENVQELSKPGPSPETLMSQKTGRKQYISTERYRTATDMQRLSNSIIAHSRELQEHCKDLEQEPYKDWAPGDPDIFTEQARQSNPDFVALEQEEKVRKLELQARLKSVHAQVDEAAQALNIAKTRGVPAANAYLNKIAKKDDFTKPAESKQTGVPTQKIKDAAPPNIVSASWDDFDQHLMTQLDEEAAATETKK